MRSRQGGGRLNSIRPELEAAAIAALAAIAAFIAWEAAFASLVGLRTHSWNCATPVKRDDPAPSLWETLPVYFRQAAKPEHGNREALAAILDRRSWISSSVMSGVRRIKPSK